MRTSVALILVLCVASSFQYHSSCALALEGAVDSAVSIAKKIKGKKIKDCIPQIAEFVGQIESILNGVCNGLSREQIKQAINGSIKSIDTRCCLFGILDTVFDAKILVDDWKHHKIINLVKEGFQTLHAFKKLRTNCKHYHHLYLRETQ